MMATMTLTEFLLARIAEDEARWQDYSEHDHNDYEPGPAPWPQLLAECEAKRGIVSDQFADYEGNMDDWEGVLEWLALPYAGHPDYQPEWHPINARPPLRSSH